jgi:hypothetical protein
MSLAWQVDVHKKGEKMKAIAILAIVAAGTFALSACTQQESVPTPTVTITEQAPAPPSVDDGVVSNKTKYISFVRENGGFYASVATDLQLIEMGDIICQGLDNGLSRDQVIMVLAEALTKNNMDNENGALFGATLIVAAQRFICPAYA